MANRWIAFLRGVNVGGHNKLPMAELRAHMANAGYTDVATYIQSGNFVASTDQSMAAFAHGLTDILKAKFDINCTMLVLGLPELEALIEAVPFSGDPSKIYVYMMIDPDEPEPDLAALRALSSGDDVAWIGSALVVNAPQGVSQSKIAQRIETVFKGRTTARNLRSLKKMRALGAPGEV